MEIKGKKISTKKAESNIQNFYIKQIDSRISNFFLAFKVTKAMKFQNLYFTNR